MAASSSDEYKVLDGLRGPVVVSLAVSERLRPMFDAIVAVRDAM